MSKLIVLQNAGVVVQMGRPNLEKRTRSVSIEVDGLTHVFDESSKEGQLAFAVGNTKALEEHFSGGHYVFGPDGQLMDHDVEGRFCHPHERIETYEELLGVENRSNSMGSRFGNANGSHPTLFLGGREKRMDTQFKTEGAGGSHQIIATVQWSPLAEHVSFLATDFRLSCANGMAVSKVTDNNSVALFNDYERNLEIATNGFLSKVERGMRNRYEMVADKVITVRQAKELFELTRTGAHILARNGDRANAYYLAKIAKNIYQNLLSIYTKAGLNDPAFGAAPTNIAAIEAVDTLTQMLSHHLNNIHDSNYGIRQKAGTLLNSIMFDAAKQFTMPDISSVKGVDFDANEVFYGGFDGDES